MQQLLMLCLYLLLPLVIFGSEKDTDLSPDETHKIVERDGIWNNIYGSVVGTVFSGANALGQSLNNVGGDGLIGRFGKVITKVSEHYAGAVKFVLFTQKNPTVGFELNTGNLRDSPYVKGNPVLVIIHGFTPAGYFEKSTDNIISSFRVKDAAIKAKLNHNILVVDWCGLSSDGAYIFSSFSTATTADRVAEMLLYLSQNGYINSPKDIRITGHSLGGHTAGITGKKFNTKFGQKIARVDAIDPAGPNFDFSPSEFQLTKYDADYVHVIHCNIKMLGSHFNRGNSDFYPNGGNDLPGCELPSNFSGYYVSLVKKKAELHICNHVRCIDLYIESMEEEKRGCKCETWTKYLVNECLCDKQKNKPRLGFYCPVTAEGTYYLNITLKTEYEILPENSSSYNNYGAGGAVKELENALTLQSVNKLTIVESMKALQDMDNGDELVFNGEHLEATTRSPSKPSHVDGAAEDDDEYLGWAAKKGAKKETVGTTTDAPKKKSTKVQESEEEITTSPPKKIKKTKATTTEVPDETTISPKTKKPKKSSTAQATTETPPEALHWG